MTYIKLKEQLRQFTVFSLNDIRKIEPTFYLPRLNEWQAKGYIKKLRRGYYIFADIALNEEGLFLLANKLYSPSYVSCETALAYYGLIPETVYTITSIASRKRASFKTPIASFLYRHMKPTYLFGYDLVLYQGQGYKFAQMEKAFLDYVYLNPSIGQRQDFDEWRFNGQEFLLKVNMQRLTKYLELFHCQQLSLRVKGMLAWIKEER